MVTIKDIASVISENTGTAPETVEACRQQLRDKDLLPDDDATATAEHAVCLLLGIIGTQLGYEPDVAVALFGDMPLTTAENSFIGNDGCILKPIQLDTVESDWRTLHICLSGLVGAHEMGGVDSGVGMGRLVIGSVGGNQYAFLNIHPGFLEGGATHIRLLRWSYSSDAARRDDLSVYPLELMVSLDAGILVVLAKALSGGEKVARPPVARPGRISMAEKFDIDLFLNSFSLVE